MDNPETLPKLGKQDTGRRKEKKKQKKTTIKNTAQETKRMSNTDPTRNRG